MLWFSRIMVDNNNRHILITFVGDDKTNGVAFNNIGVDVQHDVTVVDAGFPDRLVVEVGFHLQLSCFGIVRHDDKGLPPFAVTHLIRDAALALDAAFGQRVIVMRVVAVQEVATHHLLFMVVASVEDGVELELVIAKQPTLVFVSGHFVHGGPMRIFA